jgi:ribosomal protein S18 acetylase RimI-like enzyme
MLSVRPAAPADAAVVAEYNRLLALETEHKALDGPTLAAGVAAALADPDRARYFVAEEDGEVVGQLMLTREWSDWRNGWIWWIQSVYVRQDYRRRGAFRALYEHARAAGAAEGVVGLRLYVEQDNVAAQEVYRRLGMARTGYFVLERFPL